MTRGTILHSMREAIVALWGEHGLQDVVDRLPDETRVATTGAMLSTLRWYPTRYVLDWNVAKMAGPARDDERAFRRSVALAMDLGFGRVRRVFLSFATPMLLAERAASLWRHDHSHGEISVDSSAREQGRARVTLTAHPFVHSALSRIAFAEAIRRVLALSRVRNVRETHALSGDELVIALAWDP
jgi:hypothetical protein